MQQVKSEKNSKNLQRLLKYISTVKLKKNIEKIYTVGLSKFFFGFRDIF